MSYERLPGSPNKLTKEHVGSLMKKCFATTGRKHFVNIYDPEIPYSTAEELAPKLLNLLARAEFFSAPLGEYLDNEIRRRTETLRTNQTTSKEIFGSL